MGCWTENRDLVAFDKRVDRPRWGLEKMAFCRHCPPLSQKGGQFFTHVPFIWCCEIDNPFVTVNGFECWYMVIGCVRSFCHNVLHALHLSPTGMTSCTGTAMAQVIATYPPLISWHGTEVLLQRCFFRSISSQDSSKFNKL